MKKKKFYITTAIDYTNDVIHLGHAYQKVVADALARFWRVQGRKTYYVTGTDEHGGNIEQAAKQAGEEPQQFVDKISNKNKNQLASLNVGYDRFVRTTDPDHEKNVKEFWQILEKKGDIYLGTFEGLYCFPCESYKTETELVDGRCTFHPTKELKRLTEKNYFFRWSTYSTFLRQLIEKNPNFVKPESRKREMLSFLQSGLDDIPVSRQNIRWGIQVPSDAKQVIYVWVDGLLAYHSAAKNVGFWDHGTEIVHIMGKDNVRWHALLWPAMLKSANYPLPTTIYGHGFFTFNGQRISKSLGNVIRPTDLVGKFGTDGVRYYLLRYGPILKDVDITLDKIKETYNADLANGLGNLVARVAKLCETSGLAFDPDNPSGFRSQVAGHIEAYRLDLALSDIWKKIAEVDMQIEKQQPWDLSGGKLRAVLTELVAHLRQIGFELQPFLPNTAAKILKQFTGPKISSSKPLFPRL